MHVFHRPSQNKHLCVSDYTVLPGQSNVEAFDVVIIIWSRSWVVKTAYPTARGTCSGKSTSAYDMCSFNSTKGRAPEGAAIVGVSVSDI